MGNSQPPDRKEFVARVGTFFVLVGIGMLVFFILSEAAKAPTLGSLAAGSRRGAGPEPRNGRPCNRVISVEPHPG